MHIRERRGGRDVQGAAAKIETADRADDQQSVIGDAGVGAEGLRADDLERGAIGDHETAGIEEMVRRHLGASVDADEAGIFDGGVAERAGEIFGIAEQQRAGIVECARGLDVDPAGQVHQTLVFEFGAVLEVGDIHRAGGLNERGVAADGNVDAGGVADNGVDAAGAAEVDHHIFQCLAVEEREFRGVGGKVQRARGAAAGGADGQPVADAQRGVRADGEWALPGHSVQKRTRADGQGPAGGVHGATEQGAGQRQRAGVQCHRAAESERAGQVQGRVRGVQGDGAGFDQFTCGDGDGVSAGDGDQAVVGEGVGNAAGPAWAVRPVGADGGQPRACCHFFHPGRSVVGSEFIRHFPYARPIRALG